VQSWCNNDKMQRERGETWYWYEQDTSKCDVIMRTLLARAVKTKVSLEIPKLQTLVNKTLFTPTQRQSITRAGYCKEHHGRIRPTFKYNVMAALIYLIPLDPNYFFFGPRPAVRSSRCKCSEQESRLFAQFPDFITTTWLILPSSRGKIPSKPSLVSRNYGPRAPTTS